MPPGFALSAPYYQVHVEMLAEGTAPARRQLLQLWWRRLSAAAEVSASQQTQVRDAIANLCGVAPASVTVTVTAVDPEILPDSVIVTVTVPMGSLDEAEAAMSSAMTAMGSIADAYSVLASSNLVLRSPPTITIVEATHIVPPPFDPTVAIILGTVLPTLLLCAILVFRRRKAIQSVCCGKAPGEVTSPASEANVQGV